jgi:hypothetical protein
LAASRFFRCVFGRLSVRRPRRACCRAPCTKGNRCAVAKVRSAGQVPTAVRLPAVFHSLWFLLNFARVPFAARNESAIGDLGLMSRDVRQAGSGEEERALSPIRRQLRESCAGGHRPDHPGVALRYGADLAHARGPLRAADRHDAARRRDRLHGAGDSAGNRSRPVAAPVLARASVNGGFCCISH